VPALRAEGAHPAVPASVIDVLAGERVGEPRVEEHELDERVHEWPASRGQGLTVVCIASP
jgi:hypothetical protein